MANQHEIFLKQAIDLAVKMCELEAGGPLARLL